MLTRCRPTTCESSPASSCFCTDLVQVKYEVFVKKEYYCPPRKLPLQDAVQFVLPCCGTFSLSLHPPFFSCSRAFCSALSLAHYLLIVPTTNCCCCSLSNKVCPRTVVSSYTRTSISIFFPTNDIIRFRRFARNVIHKEPNSLPHRRLPTCSLPQSHVCKCATSPPFPTRPPHRGAGTPPPSSLRHITRF